MSCVPLPFYMHLRMEPGSDLWRAKGTERAAPSPAHAPPPPQHTHTRRPALTPGPSQIFQSPQSYVLLLQTRGWCRVTWDKYQTRFWGLQSVNKGHLTGCTCVGALGSLRGESLRDFLLFWPIWFFYFSSLLSSLPQPSSALPSPSISLPHLPHSSPRSPSPCPPSPPSFQPVLC